VIGKVNRRFVARFAFSIEPSACCVAQMDTRSCARLFRLARPEHHQRAVGGGV